MADTTESELKVVLTGDETGLKETFDQVAKDFKASAAFIGADIRKMNDDIAGAFDGMFKRAGQTNQIISTMSGKIGSLKTSVEEGFGALEKALGDNNAMMDMAIRNMINLANQTRQMKQSIAGRQAQESDIAKTILLQATGFATVYQSVHTVLGGIKEVSSELLEMEKITKSIVSMTGEDYTKTWEGIVDLSSRSGIAVNDIAKAMQHAASEGFSLSKNMETIEVSANIARKTGQDLTTVEDKMLHLTELTGASAKELNAVFTKTGLLGPAQLQIMERFAELASQQGVSWQKLSAIVSTLMNDVGLSGRQLQQGISTLLNSMKDLDEVSKESLITALDGWKGLNEEQKKNIEHQLGIKKGVDIVKILGENAEIVRAKYEAINNVTKADIDLANSNPKTMASYLNEQWNELLLLMRDVQALLEPILKEFASITIGPIVEFSKAMHSLDDANQAEDLLQVQTQIFELRKKAAALGEEYIKKNPEVEKELYQEMNTLLEERQMITHDTVTAQEEFNKSLARTSKSQQESSAITKQVNGILQTSRAKMAQMASDNIESEKQFKKSLSDSNTEFQNRMKTIGETAKLNGDNIAKYSAEISEIDKQVEALKTRNKHEIASGHAVEHSKEIQDQIKKLMLERLEIQNRLQAAEKQASKAEEKEAVKEDKENNAKLLQDIRDAVTQEKLLASTQKLSNYEITKQIDGMQDIAALITDENMRHQANNMLLKVKSDLIKQNAQESRKVSEFVQKESESWTNTSVLESIKERHIAVQMALKGEQLSASQKLRMLDEELTANRKLLNEVTHGATVTQMIHKQEIANIQFKAKLEKEKSLEKRAQIMEEWKLSQQKTEDEIKRTQAVNQEQIARDKEFLDAYEKTHLTMKDIAQSLGNELKSSIGNSIDGLIKGTTNLHEAWKDFIKNLLADMAKKVVLKAIAAAAGEVGGPFGELLADTVGGAHGSTMTGVPGYAMGSPISGVDSVPAMLSPGEIVLDNNASDMFRSMISRGGPGGQGITIVIQNTPSLLGNREELIRLDQALNNPIIRTTTDRRKV